MLAVIICEAGSDRCQLRSLNRPSSSICSSSYSLQPSPTPFQQIYHWMEQRTDIELRTSYTSVSLIRSSTTSFSGKSTPALLLSMSSNFVSALQLSRPALREESRRVSGVHVALGVKGRIGTWPGAGIIAGGWCAAVGSDAVADDEAEGIDD